MSPLKRRKGPGLQGTWWTLGPVPGERLRGTRTLPSGHACPPTPSARKRSGRPSSLPGLGQGGQRPPAAAPSSSLSQPLPPPNLLGLKPKSKSKQVPLESLKIPQGRSQQFSTPGGSAPSRQLRGSGERRRIHWLPPSPAGQQVLPGSWSGGGAPHALTGVPGPACPIPQWGGSVGALALSRSSGGPAFLHAGFLCLYHGGEGTQAPLPDPRRLPTKAGRRTGPGTPESAPAAG